MTTVIARLQKGQKIGGHFEPKACASGSKWPPEPNPLKKMLSLYSNSEQTRHIMTIISFKCSKKLPNRWNLDNGFEIDTYENSRERNFAGETRKNIKIFDSE